jgi:2-keto-4-pentenoate hydratase/2-oxohepta-3-ene-1,7-dioic acid hydratase in catechol pathway
MRLVVYKRGGAEHLGFVSGDTIISSDLGFDAGAPERAFFVDTIAFIRSADAGRAAAELLIKNAPARARLALASVELAAPIRPSTILCSGSNYRDHNREKLNTPISGKEPEFFIKTADCVVGPNEPIVYDAEMSKKLDMETELAIVIGKAGRHVPLASALDHVFGYTIVNDVTARDRQVRTSPEGSTWYELGRSKAFDCSAPLGPMIVTSEEIGDPQALKLQTRINGEVRQSSNTRNMIWGCADLIHFFSTNFTLKPGMVIITGTPSGTAWSTDQELGGKWHGEPGLVPATRYCLPGDVIECELEKIGTLRNVVV